MHMLPFRNVQTWLSILLLHQRPRLADPGEASQRAESDLKRAKFKPSILTDLSLCLPRSIIN
jgi:hypothetical protein